MNKKLNGLLYAVLFSGLGVFSYFFLINYANISLSTLSILALPFFILTFNILGFSTTHISTWLHNQYPLYINKKWKIVLAYSTVTMILLLLNYGLLVTAKLLIGAQHPFNFPNGGVRILIIVWLVELVIMGLLLANKFMQNTLHLQQRAAELQEENNKAHYTALQNQLNPHFLFNTLNTLIAEIEYNPQNAVCFTKNLSDVYRYVLQCQEKPLVTLGEELEFAKAYLFLHQVRLGDCIEWNAEIKNDDFFSLLPPLTLQLLIENVIKHNSITRNKPMVITIKTKCNYLYVTNLINPKISNYSSGIGLKNLSNRCKLITNKDIDIIKNNETFTVKIPLLYE